MRLLLITNVFPSPLHPTKGVFNLELVRALRQKNEVSVICPIAWTDELLGCRRGHSIPSGRSQLLDGARIIYPRFYFLPKTLRRYYGHFMWQSVQRVLRRQLLDFRPEAVIAYWAHPDGQVAVRAARLAGVPAVVMVGGSDVLLLTGRSARRRCVLKVLQNADAIVAVSNSLRDRLIEFGIAPAKVQVVERGVDTSVFHPGNRDEARRNLGLTFRGSVLVWVGRMVPVKGLDVLLRSCGELRKRGVDFHLCLVGDGPLRAALAEQAKSEGVADLVHFPGAVAHHQLPDWYRAADVFVLPSRSEGVPNVLRECIACGIPYVASRVGGIPELGIPGCNLLVPPEDPNALADALCASLEKTGRRAEPRIQSIPSLRDWAGSAEGITGVLRALIDAPRSEKIVC